MVAPCRCSRSQMTMSPSRRAKSQLAIANRILARHGIFDEDGHVSMRDPVERGRFLMSRALSPAQVEPDDIVEFMPDGNPAGPETRALCVERFIHAAVLEVRPDIQAVLHGHSTHALAFGITRVSLRPVIGPVGDMGMHVPVWDIAEKFGDATDMLVSTMERGRDLAQCLGSSRVCLTRGAGFIATGRSLNDLVRMSVYIPRNARALAVSLQLGEVRSLSRGESAARLAIDPESNAMRRGWEHWAKEAGCTQWLAEQID